MPILLWLKDKNQAEECFQMFVVFLGEGEVVAQYKKKTLVVELNAFCTRVQYLESKTQRLFYFK